MPYSMKFAKKAKIKIQFQKMKGTFFGQCIPWLKSHQPPMIFIYVNIKNLYIKKKNNFIY